MSTLTTASRVLFTALSLTSLLFATIPPAAAQAGVDGRNVVVVEISQSGRKVGEFRRTGPRQWAEVNTAGAVAFRFEETQRDDSSVYLVDRSRGVHLQLDLRTRKVMYSEPRALYDITTASSSIENAPSSKPGPAATALSPKPATSATGGKDEFNFGDRLFENAPSSKPGPAATTAPAPKPPVSGPPKPPANVPGGKDEFNFGDRLFK